MVDSVLYRYHKSSIYLGPVRQCYAPKAVRKYILEQLHGTRIAGHLGITKTLERIKMRFYWPGAKDDVVLWCKNCTVCAQKKSNHISSAPMQHVPIGLPMERVALDLIGQLPLTASANNISL